ncbi:hypothetical protein H7827_24420 [Streptomyces sp. JH002]|uniref:hypothetical protein n=1 Tax=Streptomyces sp. JH002 TaxID=2763259 RepID=UPI003D807110
MTLPSWIPAAGSGATRVPCGRWFNAVPVPRATGELLLALVPSRGVVADQTSDTMVWFIPAGVPATFPEGVQLLGHTDATYVPSADRGPERGGVWRWVVLPRGDCLTDAVPLLTSLAAVAGRVAERCVWCGGVAYPPAVITAAGPRGRRVTVTACQRHADDVSVLLRYTSGISDTGGGPA